MQDLPQKVRYKRVTYELQHAAFDGLAIVWYVSDKGQNLTKVYAADLKLAAQRMMNELSELNIHPQ